MNIRIVLIAFFFIFLNGSIANAQEGTLTVLFAQCHFSIDNQEDMKDLQDNMRLNPNAGLVRLDFSSQRAFILTKGLESMTNDELTSWFESYSETLSCIQIGIKGVDEIAKYPFVNCEN